jgi:hypothetical protein
VHFPKEVKVRLKHDSGVQAIARRDRNFLYDIINENFYRGLALGVRILIDRSTDGSVFEVGNHLREKVRGNQPNVCPPVIVDSQADGQAVDRGYVNAAKLGIVV